MYHRIADEPIDPWDLAVSPVHFEEQLQVLCRIRHPIALTEFARNLMTDTLPTNAVALTFDDGYVDNLISGKPRLAAADVPATVFLATGYIDRPEGFWWDELAKLILLENTPKSLELVVRDESIRCVFGAESAEGDDGAIVAASFNKRRAALQTIWQTLRRLDEEERQLMMLKLRSILAGRDHCASLGRAMTGKEVQALLADGLVTIGAHTVTHPVLSELGEVACHREIIKSKLACEALTGAPVTAFAYPYGDFDAKAREAVKIAGFTFACSTRRGPAMAASDIFSLPRIHVPNLDGDAFAQALRSASAC